METISKEKEEWRDIVGYEGKYQVSNIGRVRNATKALALSVSRTGYPSVSLCKNGVMKRFNVHRLVAETFIPNDDCLKTDVNHINEIKTDNRVENLEWCTRKYNLNYGTAQERHKRNMNVKNKRPILQFSTDGTFIKRWESAGAYYTYMNRKASGGICDCCKGKHKTAHGYIWRYAEV